MLARTWLVVFMLLFNAGSFAQAQVIAIRAVT